LRAIRILIALPSLAAVATALVLAPPASADSAQIQSYQRNTESVACVTQPGETPWQAAWGADSSWSPSWEQWANAGSGGWVCTRSITWAKTQAPARSGGGSVAYRVGDPGPGGGTVFYVDMMRPAGSQFWEVGSDLGPAEWGCLETSVSGASGTALGTGEANTEAIKTGCNTEGIAARVASAPAGGLTDWFLPSKDELNQLCKYARTRSTDVVDQALPCTGDGTVRSEFASINYWSSTQHSDNTECAWLQGLIVGHTDGGSKNGGLRVRAVRNF
jgi:hypothetical protein